MGESAFLIVLIVGKWDMV